MSSVPGPDKMKSELLSVLHSDPALQARLLQSPQDSQRARIQEGKVPENHSNHEYEDVYVFFSIKHLASPQLWFLIPWQLVRHDPGDIIPEECFNICWEGLVFLEHFRGVALDLKWNLYEFTSESLKKWWQDSQSQSGPVILTWCPRVISCL